MSGNKTLGYKAFSNYRSRVCFTLLWRSIRLVSGRASLLVYAPVWLWSRWRCIAQTQIVSCMSKFDCREGTHDNPGKSPTPVLRSIIRDKHQGPRPVVSLSIPSSSTPLTCCGSTQYIVRPHSCHSRCIILKECQPHLAFQTHLVCGVRRPRRIYRSSVGVVWHSGPAAGPALHSHLYHEGRQLIPVHRPVVVNVHLVYSIRYDTTASINKSSCDLVWTQYTEQLSENFRWQGSNHSLSPRQ